MPTMCSIRWWHHRGMNVKPQMAEAIETAPDGRSCTIRLRAGLLFHDGTPVLARDAIAEHPALEQARRVRLAARRATDSCSAPLRLSH